MHDRRRRGWHGGRGGWRRLGGLGRDGAQICVGLLGRDCGDVRPLGFGELAVALLACPHHGVCGPRKYPRGRKTEDNRSDEAVPALARESTQHNA